MENKIINTWVGTLILVALSSAVGFFVVKENGDFSPEFSQMIIIAKKKVAEAVPVLFPSPLPPPLPPNIERMKKQGCVADGILSGFGGDTKEMINVVNRSDCYYLHRALETWANKPDFEKAKEIKAKIEKKDIVYGMFIAEAISTTVLYRYPEEDRKFDFEKMCQDNNPDHWKKNICIPSFNSGEYRAYLKYITEQAMDIGIQSFLFGQVFLQEGSDLDNPRITKIIADMREYADAKGMKIVVGAQTNDITNEKYLRNFDFIDGGVGLYADGTLENGPCFSRWWKKDGDWCWALLWNDKFAKKANNVFLHLDWTPQIGDDMSTFARMDDDKRRKTLRDLHNFFTSQDKGFMLPVLAVLPKDNGGCYGGKKNFYSPSKKYSCDDEKTINNILKKAW
ncbi:MAG: hypothetical protein M0P97_03430 [Candidatus Moranbacteria bacterium]|jgi:hypothetical protein|nr:hypothetical protein [Candidatus Moranbacteria bacterium]